MDGKLKKRFYIGKNKDNRLDPKKIIKKILSCVGDQNQNYQNRNLNIECFNRTGSM